MLAEARVEDPAEATWAQDVSGSLWADPGCTGLGLAQ